MLKIQYLQKLGHNISWFYLACTLSNSGCETEVLKLLRR